MPIYEYECRKCGHGFSRTMSIEEQDRAKVECPRCGSQEVTQVIEPAFVRTSRKA
jgi:putative FmdB family regulatory protein